MSGLMGRYKIQDDESRQGAYAIASLRKLRRYDPSHLWLEFLTKSWFFGLKLDNERQHCGMSISEAQEDRQVLRETHQQTIESARNVVALIPKSILAAVPRQFGPGRRQSRLKTTGKAFSSYTSWNVFANKDAQLRMSCSALRRRAKRSAALADFGANLGQRAAANDGDEWSWQDRGELSRQVRFLPG